MKKVLLGSTALVAASLMAGPAFAQLELSISGSVDVHGGFVSEDLDTGRRSVGITTDTTLNFDADGVADNGLEYGSRINVDDSGNEFRIDETWVYVSGTFGEVRFGATDPAASELRFAIPTVGNGQADGDFGRYTRSGDSDPGDNDSFIFGTDFVYSGDDNKVVYIGEFGDFTVGASYSPTDASVGSNPALFEADDNDDLEDIISLGGNFQGEFGGTSVGVSAGLNSGDYEGTGPLDSHLEYGVGAEVGFGAVTVGGFWISATIDQVGGAGDIEVDGYGLGATFTTGPWGFAANALLAESEAPGTAQDVEDVVYGVGVEYSLADGLTPYADLVFFDNDVDGTANDNDGSVFLVGITASF